jgi:hypothetical protein
VISSRTPACFQSEDPRYSIANPLYYVGLGFQPTCRIIGRDRDSKSMTLGVLQIFESGSGLGSVSKSALAFYCSFFDADTDSDPDSDFIWALGVLVY